MWGSYDRVCGYGGLFLAVSEALTEVKQHGAKCSEAGGYSDRMLVGVDEAGLCHIVVYSISVRGEPGVWTMSDAILPAAGGGPAYYSEDEIAPFLTRKG